MGDTFSKKYRDIHYAKVSYDQDANENDIAILVLKEEVEFSSNIRFNKCFIIKQFHLISAFLKSSMSSGYS